MTKRSTPAQRKEEMGYVRSSPRCSNCVHFISTKVNDAPGTQPQCAEGSFRIHVWGKCDHWTRRLV